jgi:hypothetical protein
MRGQYPAAIGQRNLERTRGLLFVKDRRAFHNKDLGRPRICYRFIRCNIERSIRLWLLLLSDQGKCRQET